MILLPQPPECWDYSCEPLCSCLNNSLLWDLGFCENCINPIWRCLTIAAVRTKPLVHEHSSHIQTSRVIILGGGHGFPVLFSYFGPGALGSRAGVASSWLGFVRMASKVAKQLGYGRYKWWKEVSFTPEGRQPYWQPPLSASSPTDLARSPLWLPQLLIALLGRSGVGGDEWQIRFIDFQLTLGF
jgi:hypothetical protein